MSEWTIGGFGLVLDEVRPVLNGLKTVAETAETVLDPLATVVETATEVIAAVDVDDFDIDFLINLLGTVDIVHLYPSQPYQILRYSQWAEAAAYSLGAGADAPNRELCTSPPYALIGVVVVADAPARLLELAADLRTLFGYVGTGFDDTPLELDRVVYPVARPACVRIDEEVPVLGSIADFLQAEFKFSAAAPTKALRDAILNRLDKIRQQIQDIQTLVGLIDELDVPEVRSLAVQGISSRDGLYSALVGATGIGSSQFVAGSVLVTDTVGAVALSPLLGLPDFEDFVEGS